MKGKQKILHWGLALALSIAVIIAGMQGSRHAADPVCNKIAITIQDSTLRQYVTPAELQQQLQGAGLWQVGQPLSTISCHAIELNLLTHPMLREAECYKMHKGEIRIIVTQRQPLLQIAGDEHYYLDTDRRVMPIRASVNTPVVIVSGRIGKQQAQGEMFDFVVWLTENKFWRQKIHKIRVVNPKMIELIEDEHQYTLILGSLSGAQQRLNDLQKLYEEGFDKIGYPPYKEIDLQFRDQIVGRK